MKTALLTTILFWLCCIYPAQSQDFSAGFSIHEIPDSIWQKMQGKTYQPNDVIRRDDLRYLRLMHWTTTGRRTMERWYATVSSPRSSSASSWNYTASTTLSNGYT